MVRNCSAGTRTMAVVVCCAFVSSAFLFLFAGLLSDIVSFDSPCNKKSQVVSDGTVSYCIVANVSVLITFFSANTVTVNM